MNVHQNARLTPLGRERLVGMIAQGMSFARAGSACGCSAKTAAKWWKRFRHEGRDGLRDRRSRPHCLRNPTPSTIVEQILILRRERLTGAHIAAKTGVDGQLCSAPRGAQPVARSGASGARSALRTGASGRVDPPRHKAVGHVHEDRPPHHRRSHWPKHAALKARRTGVGICACLRR